MDRHTPPLRPGGACLNMGTDLTPTSFPVQPVPPRSKRPESCRPLKLHNPNEQRPSIPGKSDAELCLGNIKDMMITNGKENVCPTAQAANQLSGLRLVSESKMQVGPKNYSKISSRLSIISGPVSQDIASKAVL